MKKLALALAALAAALIGLAGCGGGHGNSLIAAAIAPSFTTAPEADLTGQSNVFTGKLGAGTNFTFSAIKGVTYNISLSSSPSNEDVIVDVFTNDGTELKAKTV